MITVSDLEQALPKALQSAATPALATKINQISNDPDAAQAIRENFITYASVLKEGRFKTEDYLNAVAYISYKMMGHSNQDAWKRTFPSRYASMVAAGKSDKEISSHVSHYNKNKLVGLVREQCIIPPHVLYNDVLHRAIVTQAELMQDTKVSPKVRSDAANSLMTHLKPPEKKEVALSIGVEESDGMKELKEMLANLAKKSQDLIAQGMNTAAIAEQTFGGDLVEGRVIKDVTPKPDKDA